MKVTSVNHNELSNTAFLISTKLFFNKLNWQSKKAGLTFHYTLIPKEGSYGSGFEGRVASNGSHEATTTSDFNCRWFCFIEEGLGIRNGPVSHDNNKDIRV